MWTLFVKFQIGIVQYIVLYYFFQSFLNHSQWRNLLLLRLLLLLKNLLSFLFNSSVVIFLVLITMKYTWMRLRFLISGYCSNNIWDLSFIALTHIKQKHLTLLVTVFFMSSLVIYDCSRLWGDAKSDSRKDCMEKTDLVSLMVLHQFAKYVYLLVRLWMLWNIL